MNCLEFRRLKLADPRHVDAAGQAHLEACASCREFALEMDGLEERLAAQLNVAVPEGLAERLILRRKTGTPFSAKFFAMAASVFVAVAVGLTSWKFLATPNYARFAIDHVMNEPESFTTVRDADPQLLHQVMQNFGGEMLAPIGTVRYIKLCPVPGGTGWHIVFDAGDGKLATLILIPARHGKTGSEYARLGNWNAVARPGGQGFYAVITSSPDSLAKTDALIRRQLRWRS